jgi:hypothetical protein
MWKPGIVVVSLAVAAASLGGCSSGAKVENRSTTTGQELKDLDDARNKGLLTEDEYQKKRKQIMDRK